MVLPERRSIAKDAQKENKEWGEKTTAQIGYGEITQVSVDKLRDHTKMF